MVDIQQPPQPVLSGEYHVQVYKQILFGECSSDVVGKTKLMKVRMENVFVV